MDDIKKKERTKKLKMNIKKLMGVLLCAFMLAGLCTSPAAALDKGVYTCFVVTSYYNPDTGNVDDGGTANAALGEGMCRSATAEEGLVEIDKDGNIWLTIRLLLQSNCSNVAFYARDSYDSYSKLSYDITSEDAANDSIDYRFKVSDAGVKLKGTMYVSPMGRDVLWYLYVDTSTLKAGSGDFVVSIDESAAAAESGGPSTEAAAGEQTGSPAGKNPEGGSPSGEVGAGQTGSIADKNPESGSPSTEAVTGEQTGSPAGKNPESGGPSTEADAAQTGSSEDDETGGGRISSESGKSPRSAKNFAAPAAGVIVIALIVIFLVTKKKRS